MYNVPEYRVPEDLDAAILGGVDLRDKTNAAHTLPTAFFQRFNTLRQQVCNEDIVSARSHPACSVRNIPTPFQQQASCTSAPGPGVCFAVLHCLLSLSSVASTRFLASSCRTRCAAELAARCLHARLQPCPCTVSSTAAWTHEGLLAVCSSKGSFSPKPCD